MAISYDISPNKLMQSELKFDTPGSIKKKIQEN